MLFCCCRNYREGPSDFTLNPVECRQVPPTPWVFIFPREDQMNFAWVCFFRHNTGNFLSVSLSGVVCEVEQQGRLGLTLSLGVYLLCDIGQVTVPLGLRFPPLKMGTVIRKNKVYEHVISQGMLSIGNRCLLCNLRMLPLRMIWGVQIASGLSFWQLFMFSFPE